MYTRNCPNCNKELNYTTKYICDLLKQKQSPCRRCSNKDPILAKRRAQHKIPNAIGEIYGKLTVIAFEGISKGKSLWRCKCQCGNEIIHKMNTLRNYKKRGFKKIDCGCVRKYDNLLNKKFGALSVIEFINSENHRVWWKCKCDCGNIVNIRADMLKSGSTKTCGCFINTKLKKRPFESRYNTLCKNGKSRNYEVTLTYEEFLDFTKQDKCHYCEDKIIWHPYTGKDCKSYRSNLDRKDNCKGYTKDNCCVACWFCNEMKGSRLSYEEMLLFKPVLIQIRLNREAKGQFSIKKYNKHPFYTKDSIVSL